jgi:hypothetical protein
LKTKEAVMHAERLKRTAMPGWVKATIGLGVLALLVVAALAVGGHGPWQHGAMTGMHG